MFFSFSFSHQTCQSNKKWNRVEQFIFNTHIFISYDRNIRKCWVVQELIWNFRWNNRRLSVKVLCLGGKIKSLEGFQFLRKFLMEYTIFDRNNSWLAGAKVIELAEANLGVILRDWIIEWNQHKSKSVQMLQDGSSWAILVQSLKMAFKA